MTEQRQTTLWIFAYPISRFERNATDAQIVEDFNTNLQNDDPVLKFTPLEFTSLINDDMFNDQDNWVRAIELPID